MTPFAYRARYRLALAAEARGDLDDAKDDLELNLRLLRTADPDPEAEEQSRFSRSAISITNVATTSRWWSNWARR